MHYALTYYAIAMSHVMTGAFTLRDRGSLRYLPSYSQSPIPNSPAIEIVTPSRTYHIVHERHTHHVHVHRRHH